MICMSWTTALSRCAENRSLELEVRAWKHGSLSKCPDYLDED